MSSNVRVAGLMFKIGDKTDVSLNKSYICIKKLDEQKICFYCGSKFLVKSGFQTSKQRYLCKDCGKRFVFCKKVDKSVLWHDYIFGKQTYKQLSDKYLISVSSIRRQLSSHRTVRIVSRSKSVVILMDTTYWGRDFGIVVFKAEHKKIL